MVVSMLPLDIIEGHPLDNINTVRRYSKHLKEETSILVLPELFSTGFVKDEATFQLLAEPLEGETMQRLSAIAYEKQMAVAGSFLCRANDGTLRNRAFFINPDAGCHITYYDKRHLFILSPEHRLVTRGSTPTPIISFRGWKIALSICFDIRFPVWNRNVGDSYDMMIVPANWPDSRYWAWKHLLMARAIENMAVMIGANRAGQDQYGVYSYLSSFGVDERGKIVAEIHGNTPLRYATFNLQSLESFRKKFPVSGSADTFELTP